MRLEVDDEMLNDLLVVVFHYSKKEDFLHYLKQKVGHRELWQVHVRC